MVTRNQSQLVSSRIVRLTEEQVDRVWYGTAAEFDALAGVIGRRDGVFVAVPLDNGWPCESGGMSPPFAWLLRDEATGEWYVKERSGNPVGSVLPVFGVGNDGRFHLDGTPRGDGCACEECCLAETGGGA